MIDVETVRRNAARVIKQRVERALLDTSLNSETSFVNNELGDFADAVCRHLEDPRIAWALAFLGAVMIAPASAGRAQHNPPPLPEAGGGSGEEPEGRRLSA